MSKRRLAEEAADERHIMRIMPLGAGNEVGRSCIVLKFKGKTIMLDCGVHPGYSGHGSLPFFDGVEAEEIDLLLITHFHIDHVAALPHFTEKTNFKGRVFMTHPTKAVMQMMLRDFLRVSNISVDDQIYDDKDLNNCVSKVEIIDFHQEMMHNGIKFTPYNAGHVLGVCMYLI
ncbi:Cleavage and polyadenylation specificity factor subunit 3, partial [Phytophthora palmivora]